MRNSALHDLHLRRVPDTTAWSSMGDMRLPRAFPGESTGLAIADASHLRRAGLKGPQAAAQLASLGLPLPSRPNCWLPLEGTGLIARLGFTEYLVEDDGAKAGMLSAATTVAGAYPVIRTDTALVLAGPNASEVLLQTCSINFPALARGELALTSMAGVSVLAIPMGNSKAPLYRIWCDPSYGSYLYRTLLGIVEELGGGPMGADRLAPMLADSIHFTENP